MADIDSRIRVDNSDAARGIAAFKNDLASIPNAAAQAATRATHALRGSIDRQFNQLRKNARDLRTLISEFAIGFGLGSLIRDIFHLNAQLISAKNALGAFTDGSAQTASELQVIGRLSQDLGADLLVMTDQWTKFRAATDASKIPTREIFEIFSALAESTRVLNLDTKRTEGVFRAVIQMFSKGKVQAEELRGQLGEHIPGAFELAARGMGVTKEELDKMISSGKIVADELVPKLAEEFRRTFGVALPQATKTSQAEWNRLTNDLKFFVQRNEDLIEGSFVRVIGWLRVIVNNWDAAIKIVSGMITRFVPIMGIIGDTLSAVFLTPLHAVVKYLLGPFRFIIERIADTPNPVPAVIRNWAKSTAEGFSKLESMVEPVSFLDIIPNAKRRFKEMEGILDELGKSIQRQEQIKMIQQRAGSFEELVKQTFGKRGGLPENLGLSQDQLRALETLRRNLDKVTKIAQEFQDNIERIGTLKGDAPPELIKHYTELAAQQYRRDLFEFEASQKKKEAQFLESIGHMRGALRANYDAMIFEANKMWAEGLLTDNELAQVHTRIEELFRIDSDLLGSELRSTFDEAFSIYADFLERQKDILSNSDLSDAQRELYLDKNKELYERDLNNYAQAQVQKRQEFMSIMGDTVGQLQAQLQSDLIGVELLKSENIISESEAQAARERLIRIFQIDEIPFFRGLRSELDLLGESLNNIEQSLGESFGQLAGSAINQLADGIGRAVVEGKSLSDTLKQIGRDIVAEIISSLIKLGAQMLINFLMGKAFEKAALASSAASATAATALWTTPAYLASVATLGAAAGLGATALTAGTLVTNAIMQGVQGSVGSVFGGGRASGGPVEPNKIYEVNERGVPELFKSGGKQYLLPNDRGVVEPVRRIGETGAGGGNTNIYLNISGAPSVPEVTQRQTANGIELDIMFRTIERRIAQGIVSGESPTATAMERVYGINRNKGRLG